MSGTASESVGVRERVRLAGGRVEGGQPHGVVIMAAGTANGLTYGRETLARAEERFEGAPVFVDHATPADAQRPGGRSVRDLAGCLHGARWDGARGELRGKLELYPGAAWLEALIEQGGREPFLGLSADMWVRREGKVVLAIEEVNSVDVVVRPAAGGRFLGDDELEQVEEASMDEFEEMERVWMADDDEDKEETVGAALLRFNLERELLEAKLARSGLPESLANVIRREHTDGTLPILSADAAIARHVEAWGEAVAQAGIRHLGAGGLRVREPLDRITLAFERLMGLEVPDGAGIPRLTGLRELYDTLTGDWERHGVFRGDRVTLANATTTTMAEVTANVLNKALLAAYERREPWWRPLAHEEDFGSLQDVRWVTLGGFSDLDAVSEGDPYTELSWDDQAETSSFEKRGNYIGLTLEMIDRDDVGAVRAIPRRLAQAARRTLSGAVAGLFTANAGVGPTLSDEDPLFDDSAHGNLGTAALGDDAWWAAVEAMFSQPELNSEKALGLRPRICLVPVQLERTALELFASGYTAAGEPNVLQSAARVVVVPEWTDPTDWAAAADPVELPGVCIGYRFGRAPEIYVADSETSGAMFTHDEMRIKARFVYAVGIGDYRALYKSNVTDGE